MGPEDLSRPFLPRSRQKDGAIGAFLALLGVEMARLTGKVARMPWFLARSKSANGRQIQLPSFHPRPAIDPPSFHHRAGRTTDHARAALDRARNPPDRAGKDADRAKKTADRAKNGPIAPLFSREEWRKVHVRGFRACLRRNRAKGLQPHMPSSGIVERRLYRPDIGVNRP